MKPYVHMSQRRLLPSRIFSVTRTRRCQMRSKRSSNISRKALMKRKQVVLTPKLTMVEAINLALRQEMERDPAVIVLGEDVGKDGGVFRVTDGLWEQWPERVIDTPLAEAGVIGA